MALSATPLRAHGSTRADRFRLTTSFLGLAVYLWVIHSAKAPIASYAIGLGLFGLILQSYRLRLPAPLLWFGAFVLWAALSAAISPGAYFDSDHLSDYAKLWLIFLVACNVAQNRRQLDVLIVCWLAIYALYPVRGTLFNFAFGIGEFGRYAWNHSFSNPNDLAGLTLPVLALSVAVLQGPVKQGWIRFSALAGVIVLPALIVITQSRGGILALATLGLFILVQYRKRARGLAVGVLVAGVLVVAAPPEVWIRLGGLTALGDAETMVEVDPEGSAVGRFDIWRVATAITLANPLTGVGLGAYPLANADYADRMDVVPQARGRKDTHSMYLNAAAETGLVGLAFLLAMLGSTLLAGRRVVRALRFSDPVAAHQLNTMLVGLIAFMQAGLFASLHRVAFLYVYLGIIAATIHLFREGTRHSGWEGSSGGRSRARGTRLPGASSPGEHTRVAGIARGPLAS